MGLNARVGSPEEGNDVGAGTTNRVRTEGKFLSVDGRKTYLRGVTYGTFAAGSDASGVPLPSPDQVRRDFADMVAAGVNTVRVYTVPPLWFLDLAHEHGLLVMVGLAWEQHVTFLDDRRMSARIVERVAADVASCAGHPAVLCFSIGNEIPSSIVRWHGSRRTERFLKRLYLAVKNVDPDALVTYVNYPTTEYLRLPFLDIVAFNVFLESAGQHEDYVARLQNVAGDRPLMITELGLDSRRNSEEEQASLIEQQVRASFAGGCAGAFVFAWTDEWHRGGTEVDNWDFGLVDRERRPKLALSALSRALDETPFAETGYPAISVVVCSYNGAATIGACLAGLRELDYPSYEIIVVDDGSTDSTADIARDAGARVISQPNSGLSAARNAGLAAAHYDIVAYIDDDAWPDRDWLRYLAWTFLTTDYVAVGGPNVPPPTANLVEAAVSRGPGGPIHVLLSDREAEHIPGCNMAIRREALTAIGGFDPRFRVAGDDVDVCWRLQERGWALAFNPAAMVWHQRRQSVSAYVKQQRDYGKAEALLERKWPTKYNGRGHVEWSGQVYGESRPRFGRRSRIYYGTWGTSLFQSLYHRTARSNRPLPLMPEWYLGLAALLTLAAPSFIAHSPRYSSITQFVVAAALLSLAAWAIGAGWRASAAAPRLTRRELLLRGLTSMLFLVQPLARLWGRTRYGLTPWRRRDDLRTVLPVPRRRSSWTEEWRAHHERLLDLEALLAPRCKVVLRGAEHDRWDLDVRAGSFGGARLRLALEEYGHGRQLVRFRVWPIWAKRFPVTLALLGAAATVFYTHDLLVTELLVAAFTLVLLRALREAGSGMAIVLHSLDEPAVGTPHRKRRLRRTELSEAPVPTATEA